jgi:hypothetical protein
METYQIKAIPLVAKPETGNPDNEQSMGRLVARLDFMEKSGMDLARKNRNLGAMRLDEVGQRVGAAPINQKKWQTFTKLPP